MRNLKGFTLIELLVVISIIALLLAILMPALGKVKEKAKLVVCSSNQHQLIIGVLSYASDDAGGKFPPSIVQRRGDATPFSWPCMINYHPENPPEAFNNGGAMHYYLGSYFETLDVFNCPNGPKYDKKIVYEKYVNYSHYPGDMTQTSYNLYWGGWSLPGETHRDIDRNVIKKTFKGALSMSSKESILCSDMMNLMAGQTTWRLAHRPREGATSVSNSSGDSAAGIMQWIATLPEGEVPQVVINAGYKDGHVERYDVSETINIMNSAGQFYYLPKKWK